MDREIKFDFKPRDLAFSLYGIFENLPFLGKHWDFIDHDLEILRGMLQ